MYLTHPTERRNAFNNFPLHLCQQRHPFSKSRERLLKKKGRLPILAKAKGTLPGTAFSCHNVYTSYPPSFAARRWIQILALFTSLPIFCETTFSWQYYYQQALKCSLLHRQSKQNSFCHLYTHFYTFPLSQHSMKTLWTAPDMSHHVIFSCIF